MPGTIAIPHGWGHKGTGGWRLANRAGGANVNQLTSSDPSDVEALAGMSWLTGVPVRGRARLIAASVRVCRRHAGVAWHVAHTRGRARVRKLCALRGVSLADTHARERVA